MKTNYVLIDFENVQPRNMGFLSGGLYTIKVFLGANQANVPLEMAQALQSLGSNAEYVRITGNGSNALDFHIAYYMGRLSLETPDAEFHVISRDKGFDPLIAHLNGCGVRCTRHTSLDAFAPAKKSSAGPTPERLRTVVDYLIRRKEAKPRTVKSLQAAVKSLFGGKLSEEELKALLEELIRRGTVKVTEGGKVTYDLPAPPAKTGH